MGIFQWHTGFLRGSGVCSALLAAAVTFVALRHCEVQQVSQAQTVPPAPDQRFLPTSDAELFGAEGLSRAFRAAAKSALPAVVVIKDGTSPVCPRCGQAHEPDRGGHASSGSGARPLELLGSGVIISPQGIVLTNKHVVKESGRLVVQSADGRQFSVREIKTDSEHDIALLRLDTTTALPFVALGDSERAEIGDWVLTIGCPLELEQTVSAGIISAKNRSFCSRHQAKYLQTDAVVNPGSSGGPLLAINGTVIGITTSIASDDGGYQGIGFAVPANFVRPLLEKFNALTPGPEGARSASVAQRGGKRSAGVPGLKAGGG